MPSLPVTYHDAEDWYGPGVYKARERFEELTNRDLTARSIVTLKARGTYDPVTHPDPAKYPPLTIDERLELLALGEMLARYYRHPAQVHHTLEAGATWAQVAAARGTSEATARREYRTWADGQHHLWLHYQGKFGMNEAEHATAIARAERDPGPLWPEHPAWPEPMNPHCQFAGGDMCDAPAVAQLTSRATGDSLWACAPHADHLLKADPGDIYVSWMAQEGAPDPGHSRQGREPSGEPADHSGTWDGRQVVSDAGPDL